MSTLLPLPKIQISDQNGNPLAGGTIGTYIPGTFSAKQTWTDSGQTTLNTNPITLDASGEAIIYGSGIYRFYILDASGNLIYDQLTASTDVGSFAWGGVSTGSANAQTVSASSFSQQDGQQLGFIAGFSNSGPLTVNPGGSGAIPVLLNSPTGPTPLVGGEVVADNEVTLVYEAARGAFHLTNAAIGTMSFQNANAVAITGGTVAGVTMSGSSIATLTIVLKQSATPAPTAEGDIQWDTDDNTLKIGDGAATATIYPGPTAGALFGLTMTNGSDATNDIDFATGIAADSTNVVNIILASGLTKQLDATWVAGTNAGGRFSAAAIANTTYYCFVIFNPSTGSVDAGFDTSVTAANKPSGYTYFRRVGAIVRTGGSIKAFIQRGDVFTWSVTAADVSTNNPGTSAITSALTVPSGLVVEARVILEQLINGAFGTALGYALITDLSQTDTTPSASAFTVVFTDGDGSDITFGTEAMVFTNTSAQVRYRLSASTASVTTKILTVGWIDTRGRLS